MSHLGNRRRAIRIERRNSCLVLLFFIVVLSPACIGAAIGIAAAATAIGMVPSAMSGAFPFNIFNPDAILSERLGVELRDLGAHNPKAFDPVKGLSTAQDFAGTGTELVSIRAMGVRMDGTIDLTANYRPTVTYVFVRPVPPPADAPPLGAGGNATGEWYETITVEVQAPGQHRQITSIGGSGNTQVQYVTKGMERESEKPVATAYPKTVSAPVCGFEALWSAARERGVPADAVATIEYGINGYAFSVTGTSHRLQADLSCEVR